MISFFIKAGIAIALFLGLFSAVLVLGNALPTEETAAALVTAGEYIAGIEVVFPVLTLFQIIAALFIFEAAVVTFQIASWIYRRFESL